MHTSKEIKFRQTVFKHIKICALNNQHSNSVLTGVLRKKMDSFKADKGFIADPIKVR